MTNFFSYINFIKGFVYLIKIYIAVDFEIREVIS